MSEAGNAEKTSHQGLMVKVMPSTNAKCERCWHHRPDVGQNEQYSDLCGRCVANVDGEGEARSFA
jgi:isoleucyl-tRNA synthetase